MLGFLDEMQSDFASWIYFVIMYFLDCTIDGIVLL